VSSVQTAFSQSVMPAEGCRVALETRILEPPGRADERRGLTF